MIGAFKMSYFQTAFFAFFRIITNKDRDISHSIPNLSRKAGIGIIVLLGFFFSVIRFGNCKDSTERFTGSILSIDQLDRSAGDRRVGVLLSVKLDNTDKILIKDLHPGVEIFSRGQNIWSYELVKNESEAAKGTKFQNFILAFLKVGMPVAVSIVPNQDEFIGLISLELNILPQPQYTISIGSPTSRGKTPQLWKCESTTEDCKLADLTKTQFVTFQDIRLKAEIVPSLVNAKYSWKVSSSEHCKLLSSGPEMVMNCNETGDYDVSIIVQSDSKITIGRADKSVRVCIKAAELAQARVLQIEAKEKILISKKFDDRLQKVDNLCASGNLDEALKVLDELLNENVNSLPALQFRTKLRKSRAEIQTHLRNTGNAIMVYKFEHARAELQAAKGEYPNYPPSLELERQLASELEKIQFEALPINSQVPETNPPSAVSKPEIAPETAEEVDPLFLIGLGQAIRADERAEAGKDEESFGDAEE